jgi:hypothetical protein
VDQSAGRSVRGPSKTLSTFTEQLAYLTYRHCLKLVDRFR